MKQRFPAARIPAYTLLAAMAVLSVFYYFNIQQNERYLVRRAFQTLVDMGEDIAEKVESADEAAENFCGPGQKRCANGQGLTDYFVRRVRDVDAYEPDSGLLPRVYPLKEPVTLGIRLDPFKGRAEEKELLDALVVADEKGKPLRSWRLLAGAAALAPDAVERALKIEESQKGKPEGDVIFDGRSGGVPHRFLIHRITIPGVHWRQAGGAPACETPAGEEETCASRTPPRPAAGPAAKTAAARPPQAGDRTLVLCGLIATERLRSESMQIPHTIGLLLVFFVLLAITSMPLLQVQFMNARQRFSRMDLVGLVFGNIVAAVLLTCGFLTMHYFYVHQRARTDFQLRALAGEVERHLTAEVAAIRGQVADFTRQFAAVTAKGARTGWRRASVLSCKEAVAYPYFDTIIWLDGKGCQRAKWTTLKENTPFVSVKDREYFKAALDGTRLWHSGSDPEGFFLESLRSKNTAQIRSVVSVPLKPPEADGKAAPFDPSRIAVAAVVGRLMSVMEPTLPAGFGFALVDASGKVMFHSVEGRSQREDFLEETAGDSDLRSAFLERRTETVDADYYGRPHRVLVHQLAELKGAPWTLMVFRDKTASRDAMVQVITITGRLLIWYAIGLALVFGALFLLPVREPLECRWVNLLRRLWPDPRLDARYRVAVAVLLAVLLAMAAAVAWGPLWLKVAMAAVSLAALPAVVWAISAGAPDGPAIDTTVPHSYSTMAFLMLVVLAVAPSGAFYRAALEFESEVQSRYSQLSLWKRLGERADRVRKLFEGRDAAIEDSQRDGLVKRRLLTPLMSGPETGNRLQPDIYLAGSFRPSTWIEPAPAPPPGRVTRFLRDAMASYRGQYGRHSWQSQQALAGSGPDGSWTWAAGDGGYPELSSKASNLRLAAVPVPAPGKWRSLVALGGLIALGYAWTWLCARRVFFFDTDKGAWDESPPDAGPEFEKTVQAFRDRIAGGKPKATAEPEAAEASPDDAEIQAARAAGGNRA